MITDRVTNREYNLAELQPDNIDELIQQEPSSDSIEEFTMRRSGRIQKIRNIGCFAQLTQTIKNLFASIFFTKPSPSISHPNFIAPSTPITREKHKNFFSLQKIPQNAFQYQRSAK